MGVLFAAAFFVESAHAQTTSTTPSVTIPAAPSELTGSIFNNVSGPNVSLHVTDNANNETEYRLYWHLIGAAWPSTFQSTSAIGTSGTWGFPANSGGFQLATPPQSGTYEYQVKACNSAGCSDSNIVQIAITAKPAAPSNLNFDPAPLTDRIYLKWNDNSSDEAGFYVDRKFITDTNYAGSLHWATLPANTTMFTDMNVVPGQRYDYRVSAYNSTGTSDAVYRSNVMTTPATPADTTSPSVPASVYVTLIPNSSSVNLYWSPSTDNVGVTGYKVYQNGIFLLDVPSTLTPSVGNLSSGQYYSVAAYDAAGNVSNVSPSVSGTTPSSNPTSPTSTPVITAPIPFVNTTSTPTTSAPVIPTPTPPPTMSYGSWPSTQTDCQSFSGRWCSTIGSSYSGGSGGYCQMANMTCPVMPRSGYMSCWDKSEVPNGGNCPVMPQNQTDCTKMGKNWCSSTYGGPNNGWCSPDICQMMTPPGQMTCPDGKTFVTSFDNCPRTNVTTPLPVIPNPEFTTCPTGKVVRKGDPCPAPDATVTCANGTTAPTITACPPIEVKQDEITKCLNTGNVWCPDTKGQTTGWCQMSRGPCVKPLMGPPLPEPAVQYRPLTAREIRDMERTRKNFIQELGQMQSAAKRAKEDALLTKITAERKSIETVKLLDSSAFDIMSSFGDDMTDLRDATSQIDTGGGSGLDEKQEAKALKQMKQGAKSFVRTLTAKKSQIDKLVKQGVSVDSDIIDLVTQALEIANKVGAATTYDDVRSLMEQIPNLAEQLNDAFQKLEMLSRLPRALAIIDREIVNTNRVVKQAQTQALRRGIQENDLVQKMSQTLTDARTGADSVRSGKVAADDVFDFIQSDILDKLQDARDTASGVIAVANAQATVGKIKVQIAQYTKRIRTLNKAGQDTSAASSLVADLSTQNSSLQNLTSAKLTSDTAEKIVEALDAIHQTVQDLESALGLAKPNAVIDELRQSLNHGGQSFDEIRVNDLEKLIVRAHSRAHFADSLITRTKNIALAE